MWKGNLLRYTRRVRRFLNFRREFVLFGHLKKPEKSLLGQPGIAIVGSRHLDDTGKECAEFVGNACGLSGLVLYSGGAKGVDSLSMNAALSAQRVQSSFHIRFLKTIFN